MKKDKDFKKQKYKKALRNINNKLNNIIENTEFKKEGCTINFCILDGKTLYISNAGDSKCIVV